MTQVASNLAAARERLKGATLIAVTKTQSIESIREALAAGQRVFGENRVQEAAGKYIPLRQEFPDIELHLIGPLQTNKAKDAVELFDVIQTLDRPELAEALTKA
ncbi:MAG: alanine racemase, partial [Bdellovibrionales bacterium]